MTMTMKSVTLTLYLFVAFLANVNAQTSSLVLHNAASVSSGQSSTYNCTSSGNSIDPVIKWTLEDSTSVVESDSDLTSVYVSGTGNSNDGAITSSVTLVIDASYLTSTHRLYCGAYDNGSTTATLRIYTVLSATSANLGQVCATSDCSTAFSVCSTSETPSRCRCSSNYYDTNGDTAGGSCNQKVGLGATCAAGIDASCSTTNAECSQTSPYNCQCQSGYVQSNSLCILSSAGVFESCVSPTRNCPANAFCNGATCQCSSGYTYSSTSSSCVSSSASVGGSCTNPTRTCPDNSFCSSTCQCNSGYFASSGLCFSNTASIGQSCTNPQRSCPLNANCGGSDVCQCDTGYTTSGNSCQQPTLGQSCTASIGCQSTTLGSSTQCLNSVCSCLSNYYTLSNDCYQKRALGVSCTQSVSNSCADTYASCTGSSSPTCQCNSGYVKTGSICEQDTSSQSCSTSSQSSSTITGISSPSASTTPSVRVEHTCYSVALYDTQKMACKDTKSGLLKSARWIKLPNSVVVASTGSFINGDQSNPNLTVSNAQASYAGNYKCQLCYGDAYTRCTNSSTIVLYVQGTAITSVSVSTSPSTTPTKGDQVTMTCETTPAGVATSYVWYKGDTQIGTGSTYTVAYASTSSSGEYSCDAVNSYGTETSSGVTVDVQYGPEFSVTGGGSTETVEWNFDNGDVDVTCVMTANPAITKYYFYDGNDNLLTSPFTTSDTFTVTSTLGYQTYSCKAENTIATSNSLYFEVVEETAANTGAATENTGISTGTIAAIVLGIIFFLLLLIIIIVCCCNYGWCRKKEKVEPQPPPPAAKPYIPRNIVSAHSTVTRKDVGIMMNGHHDVSVSTDFEEPRYTTPRYHLKPAKNAGPIISMFDDGYEQPRAHQLPALDTQYLYTDEEPKKRHKKKRRRRQHRESSPRRHDYEPEPVTLPPSDEDLVVIPGKQNYFE